MRCFGTTTGCRTRLSFLHFAPLSIILFSFVLSSLWLHGSSICHHAASDLIPIFSILCSFLFKNLFLIHHPLFSSLLAPLIVFCVYPPSSILLLHLTSSTSSTDFSPPPPLNSPFWFCVFTVYRFTLLAFSHIPVFLFHPSSKTHVLVPTPPLICHFSLLLSTSPRPGLVHNHNFIAFPLKLCSHTHLPLLSVNSVVIEAVISCVAAAPL